MGRGRPLQCPEHTVADSKRVGPGVERQRVLGRTGDAEVVRGGAAPDQQIVVGDGPAVGQPQVLGLEVEADRPAAHHVGAVGSGEAAERVHDVSGVQTGRGDLVQQWLEGRVRVLVDEGHVDAVLGEASNGGDPGEAAAEDHDLGPARATAPPRPPARTPDHAPTRLRWRTASITMGVTEASTTRIRITSMLSRMNGIWPR